MQGIVSSQKGIFGSHNMFLNYLFICCWNSNSMETTPVSTPSGSPYQKSAPYFDLLQEWKDYKTECKKISKMIKHYFGHIWDGRKGKISMLDVGCATGKHISFFKERFAVQGLDNNPVFLEVAKKAHPEVTFYLANMIEFTLDATFDVILCLSSIGYARHSIL